MIPIDLKMQCSRSDIIGTCINKRGKRFYILVFVMYVMILIMMMMMMLFANLAEECVAHSKLELLLSVSSWNNTNINVNIIEKIEHQIITSKSSDNSIA